MKPQVDLIWDDVCPNVQAARTNLLKAFTKANYQPRWSEWRIGEPDLPEHVRGYGSPTILVNGVDVAGVSPSNSECCRVYVEADGSFAKAPSVEQIVEALSVSHVENPTSSRFSGRSILSVLPAIGMGLLPKVACPACWPAYAGILGSVGLGFLIDTTWLFSLTAIFLVVAVGALAFRARQRHGYKPFMLGLLASAVLMFGKFVFNNDPSMYVGVGLLVIASVWNTWPKKDTAAMPCPRCVVETQ